MISGLNSYKNRLIWQKQIYQSPLIICLAMACMVWNFQPLLTSDLFSPYFLLAVNSVFILYYLDRHIKRGVKNKRLSSQLTFLLTILALINTACFIYLLTYFETVASYLVLMALWVLFYYVASIFTLLQKFRELIKPLFISIPWLLFGFLIPGYWLQIPDLFFSAGLILVMLISNALLNDYWDLHLDLKQSKRTLVVYSAGLHRAIFFLFILLGIIMASFWRENIFRQLASLLLFFSYLLLYLYSKPSKAVHNSFNRRRLGFISDLLLLFAFWGQQWTLPL